MSDHHAGWRGGVVLCKEHGKRVVGHRGRLLHPDDEPKTWCSPDYRNGLDAYGEQEK